MSCIEGKRSLKDFHCNAQKEAFFVVFYQISFSQDLLKIYGHKTSLLYCYNIKINLKCKIKSLKCFVV